MTHEIVRVSVERYDPEKKESFMQTYDVPRGDKVRVLDYLEYIFEEIDPSLGYRRHLCKAKMCHACLMLVNDSPRMVCWEKVASGQTALKLAPIQGKRIIKDLIVDWDAADTADD